jgi:hypothetical protein
VALPNSRLNCVIINKKGQKKKKKSLLIYIKHFH